MNIDSIKEIMDSFDPAALLPDLSSIFGWIELICRIAVMVGPVILLLMGLAYLLLPPKEANHYFGYQCYFGMGSVQAWRFTQRFAGIVLGVTGLILTGVMFYLSSGFHQMAVTAMVWRSVVCLFWEAIVSILAFEIVNLTAMLLFDRKGVLRRQKKEEKAVAALSSEEAAPEADLEQMPEGTAEQEEFPEEEFDHEDPSLDALYSDELFDEDPVAYGEATEDYRE